MSWRRVTRLLVAVLMLIVVGCQAEVAIDLAVDPDGSGMVRVATVVDAEADQLFDGFADQVRTDDLERAGWDVVKVQRVDGTAAVTATKRVMAPDSWQAVLDEIAGRGVFVNVQVGPTPGFATADQQLTFELDLRDGWDLFSDEEATEVLGGEPFGMSIETLTNGRAIDDIISIELTATVASDADATPASKTFTPRFDQGEPLQVSVGSTTENSSAVVLRWIAIALFSLFVVATALAITGIVLQRRSDRLRPPPTPAPVSSAAAVPAPEVTVEPAATPDSAAVTSEAVVTAAATSTEPVRLVVIEPLSVLYQQTTVVDAHLLPFVHRHGGTARADTIVQGHRALLTGSSDTQAFWKLCAVAGVGEQLDQQYVGERSLRDGAAAFLAEMQRRRIPVAATTNDAATWSHRARQRDRLSAVWPWLVSSVVGTTTSNGAMFEALHRESGVAYSHCLFVDTDLASLDTAKELGMKTALFDIGDLDLSETHGHPIITDFDGLFNS